MNDYGTVRDRSAVHFERYLPGPIDRVWSYLTDSNRLAEWFSAGVVDAHVGGNVRFDMGTVGKVTAYDPPHLLEYTWTEEETPHGPIPNALVRWELAESGHQVRLTLTHSRMPEPALASLGAGWHMHLDGLAAILSGRTPAERRPAFESLRPQYAQRFKGRA